MSKKYLCKKVTINDPDNEEEMIDMFFKKEYSKILDILEIGVI